MKVLGEDRGSDVPGRFVENSTHLFCFDYSNNLVCGAYKMCFSGSSRGILQPTHLRPD